MTLRGQSGLHFSDILDVKLEDAIVQSLQELGQAQIGIHISVIRRFGILADPAVHKDLAILIAGDPHIVVQIRGGKYRSGIGVSINVVFEERPQIAASQLHATVQHLPQEGDVGPLDLDGVHEDLPRRPVVGGAYVGAAHDGPVDRHRQAAAVGKWRKVGQERDAPHLDLEFAHHPTTGRVDDLPDLADVADGQGGAVHVAEPVVLLGLLRRCADGSAGHEERGGAEQLRVRVQQLPCAADGSSFGRGGIGGGVELFQIGDEGGHGGLVGGGGELTPPAGAGGPQEVVEEERPLGCGRVVVDNGLGGRLL